MTTRTTTKILNLPNMLTMLRIAAIPLIAALLVSPTQASGFWAAAIFARLLRSPTGLTVILPAVWES